MRILRASMYVMNRSDMACSLCSNSHHGLLAHEQDHTRPQGGGAAHPQRLPRQAALAEEVTGTQHRHHRLAAGLRQHRQLHAASLDVHHVLALVALREDGLVAAVGHEASGHAGRAQEVFGAEGRGRLGRRVPRPRQRRRAFPGRFHLESMPPSPAGGLSTSGQPRGRPMGRAGRVARSRTAAAWPRPRPGIRCQGEPGGAVWPTESSRTRPTPRSMPSAMRCSASTRPAPWPTSTPPPRP